MTDRERNEFEEMIADLETRANLLRKIGPAILAMAIAIACGCAAALPFVLGWDWLVAMMFAMPLGFAANLGFYQLVVLVEDYRKASKEARKFVPKGRLILEDGRVDVMQVTSDRVIEIEPIGDNDLAYLFDLGDGRILILKGQDYDFAEDNAPWPNSEFDLIRTYEGDAFLGVFARGKELDPIRIIGSDDLDPCFFQSDFETILTADLEAYADSLIRSH